MSYVVAYFAARSDLSNNRTDQRSKRILPLHAVQPQNGNVVKSNTLLEHHVKRRCCNFLLRPFTRAFHVFYEERKVNRQAKRLIIVLSCFRADNSGCLCMMRKKIVECTFFSFVASKCETSIYN